MSNPKVNLYVSGAAQYRAGRYNLAMHLFHQSMATDPSWQGNAMTWLMLAMTHHRLGQTKEARQWLDKARKWIADAVEASLKKPQGTLPMNFWEDWLECQVLLGEAEKLILGTASAPNPLLHVLRGRAYTAIGLDARAAAEFALAAKRIPDNPYLRAERARLHVQQGEWEDALIDFTKAIAERPDDAALYWERGRVYARFFEWDKIGADFAKALDLPSVTPSERGRAYFELVEWPKAAAKTLALRPKEVELRMRQGIFFAGRGLWDEAIGIEKALALHPRPPRLQEACLRLLAGDKAGYRQACADLLKQYKQKNDAALAYEAARACNLAAGAVDDPRQVIELARTALAAQPNSAWRLYVLGTAHYRAGQFEPAIKFLESSLKAEPGWKTPAVSWLVLAMATDKLGRQTESRRWLDRAVQWLDKVAREALVKAPGPLPMIWWDWAELQILRREAETLIKGKTTENPYIQLARGRTYANLGLADKATAEYARAAKVIPDDPDLRINRGRLLVEQSKWDLAAADYSKVIASCPFDDPWFEHACLRLLAGDTKGFQQFCEKVLKEHGQTQTPFAGYVAARIGAVAPQAIADASQLEKWAKLAVQSDPTTAWFVHALALAHCRAGRYKEAVRRFHESIEVGPWWGGNPLNWLGLALAHQRLGQQHEARQWLARAERWYKRVRQGAAVHPSDWLEYQVLRREVYTLIGEKLP
jgi:tetratricopeptide (TPR) repeat protein